MLVQEVRFCDAFCHCVAFLPLSFAFGVDSRRWMANSLLSSFFLLLLARSFLSSRPFSLHSSFNMAIYHSADDRTTERTTERVAHLAARSPSSRPTGPSLLSSLPSVMDEV